MDKVKFFSKIFAIVVLVALMVAAILQLQEFATKPKDKYLQGQMEALDRITALADKNAVPLAVRK